MRRLLIFLLALLPLLAQAENVEKVVMPGEVIAGHAKIEQECKQCHVRFDRAAQTRLCLDCHKDIARDIASRTRLHGRQEEAPCRTCHTDHKGRQAKIAGVDKAKFDHAKTEFRLNGAHAEVRNKCESCHLPKRKFREAPRLCNDCHGKDDQEKGHKGKLGNKCDNCHNEKRWSETRFNHEKTHFPLAGGKHAEVKCRECHADKTYQKTPLTCNGCHEKTDKEKGHKGRYGIKCETCHDDSGWKEIRFDHDTDTHYTLKGKHRQTKCNACHLPEKGTLYQQKLSARCVACHKGDDQEKGHKGGLGDKCESCHNERNWKAQGFNHDDTHFPLRDKHRDAKCESCHKGGVAGASAKLKLETACVACHRKEDQEKGHKGRYGNKCETCHTAKDWKSMLFDHDKDTRYTLKGKHRQAKCDACHLPERGPIYSTKTDAACIACHRQDDKHKGQLGNACDNCHDEKRWQGARFDHNRSRFPLTGSHARTECRKCHQTPAFKDAPMACIGCHEKEDKHRGVFGRKCGTCHYTGTWKSWDFDHGTTRFMLDGAHARIECGACHKEGQGGKANRDCATCHAADDVHRGALGRQCEQCHAMDNWRHVRRRDNSDQRSNGGVPPR